MTRSERSAIRNAMKLIHADEDKGGSYEMGMDILADLVGWKKMATALEGKPISIFELMKTSVEAKSGGANEKR